MRTAFLAYVKDNHDSQLCSKCNEPFVHQDSIVIVVNITSKFDVIEKFHAKCHMEDKDTRDLMWGLVWKWRFR